MITSPVPTTPMRSFPDQPPPTPPLQTDPANSSFSVEGSTSPVYCKPTTTPSSLAPNASEPITIPVSTSASGNMSPSVTASPSWESLPTRLPTSGGVSPLSVVTLPKVSPSGSRSASPCPSSPTPHPLSPGPACQCVPPNPPLTTQTHTDPSKIEIFI